MNCLCRLIARAKVSARYDYQFVGAGNLLHTANI